MIFHMWAVRHKLGVGGLICVSSSLLRVKWLVICLLSDIAWFTYQWGTFVEVKVIQYALPTVSAGSGKCQCI